MMVYKPYLAVHGCLLKGLSGKAAVWAVQKYQWHRGVSNTAYNALKMSAVS